MKYVLTFKAYIDASWTEGCLEPLKPFIRQCLFLSWMMVVLEPPVCFLEEVNADKHAILDTNMYRRYKSGGKYLCKIIWPAMFLHKDGPLLCKGIAEGKDRV